MLGWRVGRNAGELCGHVGSGGERYGGDGGEDVEEVTMRSESWYCTVERGVL